MKADFQRFEGKTPGKVDCEWMAEGNRGKPNSSSSCENLLSSLPGSLQVFASYFIAGNAVERKYGFDCKVLVVGPWYLDDSLLVYPVSNVEELSFLECLLLRELIKHIDSPHSVVLGARFGPRMSRGGEGKILSPLEALLSGGNDFMRDVLAGFRLASPHYPLFSGIPPDSHIQPLDVVSLLIPPHMAPEFVQALMEDSNKEEALNDDWVAGLNKVLYWIIYDVGLAKLLTIPELDRKQQRKQLPLTRQDASRIRLIQDVVQPRYNIRPAKELGFIGAHWAKIAARLFVYGPILDLVNTFQEKRIVKVCWNCGKLYRPCRYKKEEQKYCSREPKGYSLTDLPWVNVWPQPVKRSLSSSQCHVHPPIYLSTGCRKKAESKRGYLRKKREWGKSHRPKVTNRRTIKLSPTWDIARLTNVSHSLPEKLTIYRHFLKVPPES